VRKQQVIKYLIIAALAALFLYVASSSGLKEYVSQKAILAQLEKMGGFAPFGFMALMAVTVVSPLPSLPLDIAAGVFFWAVSGDALFRCRCSCRIHDKFLD